MKLTRDTPILQTETPDESFAPSTLRERVQDAYINDPWFSDPKNTANLKFRHGGWYAHNVLWVPNDAAIQLSILKEVHDSPWAGHMGITKTLHAVKRHFYWPTVRKDVIQHVKSCHQCQTNKLSTQRPAGLLKPLQLPGRPWASVSMDYIVALPKTLTGYDSILVMVDRLTKMVHFAPTTVNATAKDTADLFVHNVVRLHGLPTSMVSDRDSRFT